MKRYQHTRRRVVMLGCVLLTLATTTILVGAGGAFGRPAALHGGLAAQTASLTRLAAEHAIRGGNASDVPAPIGNLPGWRQIYLDDFAHPSPLGSFGECDWRRSLSAAYCPHLVGSDRRQLASYDDWIIDTLQTGRYMPSQVLSIDHGTLDFWLHTVDGVPAGAVVAPKIPAGPDGTGRLYGAYAVRFRASANADYHFVVMLWADAYSNGVRWPDDGEIDFPEGNLNGHLNGYLHFEGDDGPAQYVFNDVSTFSRWHTAVIEWLPNQLEYVLDGRVVAVVHHHIPHVPMHLLLQAETGQSEPAAGSQGHIQVAWVSAYAPD